MLSSIWADALNLDKVGLDDSFFDLGGTSGKAAEVFAQMQRHFSAQLLLSSLYNASTIRDLAELIDKLPGPPPPSFSVLPSDRLVPISETGDSPPLFMIPGAPGDAISLANIARELASEQPIYGLDAIGCDGKEQPLYDQHAIAAEHADTIAKSYPGPYYLFGFCHGAVTAFEIAHILRSKGKQVAFLALVDPMNVDRPRLKRGDDKLTATSFLTFATDHFNYWRTHYRRKRLRDHLGIRSKKDRLDPQRPVRRHIRLANRYAGRRYKPEPYSGVVNLYLSQDMLPGRKKDGGRFWLETLSIAQLNVEYIRSTGTAYLSASEGAACLAEAMRPHLQHTKDA